MPQQVATLSYDAQFTPAEFERISHGLIPEEMEDKWFIHLEGMTLYLHRSWTGFCIYQVELEERAGQFVAARTLVSRDPDQYGGTDDHWDAEVVHFLISNFLLGRGVAFPIPDRTSQNPAGLIQHHIS